MSNLLSEIYLDISNVSKFKTMFNYYTGVTDNILKELREQHYSLKIDQHPYTEDLNKVKYSLNVPGLKEPVNGEYIISNKLAFNSKIGNFLAKIHFNNLLSNSLTKKLQKAKNDVILTSNLEARYNLEILLDLVEKIHVKEHTQPTVGYIVYMSVIHQMAFLQEFDTSNLIELSKVVGYKDVPVVITVNNIFNNPPNLLYNLDKNRIEKTRVIKYITISFKDGISNYSVSFYMSDSEIPEGVYKSMHIDIIKGHIVDKRNKR